MTFKAGDRVTLKSDPRQHGVVNHVIDRNADVPYYWVNWPSGIRGHRESDLCQAIVGGQ